MPYKGVDTGSVLLLKIMHDTIAFTLCFLTSISALQTKLVTPEHRTFSNYRYEDDGVGNISAYSFTTRDSFGNCFAFCRKLLINVFDYNFKTYACNCIPVAELHFKLRLVPDNDSIAFDLFNEGRFSKLGTK